MSNNCLVTKLKSVVDNDNLPILGSIVYNLQLIYNEPVAVFYGIGAIDNTCSIDILDNAGYFTNEDGNENYGDNISIVASSVGRYYIKCTNQSGKLTVRINSNYKLTTFDSRIGAIKDMSSLKWQKSLNRLVLMGQTVYGNIEDFKDCPINSWFSFDSPTVVGNFEKLNFMNFFNEKTMGGFYIYGTGISGTVEGYIKNNIDKFNNNVIDKICVAIYTRMPQNFTLHSISFTTPSYVLFKSIVGQTYTFEVYNFDDEKQLTMIYNKSTDTWSYTD